ncbi:MAG: DUF3050 domain-containing protein [Crocinitomicaceae bacterium]|jgi:hypothetical protein|nr:DUF3050 domain-containing protein [Crocinitomicaceae bacterium]
MNPRLNHIEKVLEPLRTQLSNHPLYRDLENLADVRVFMENHVYAVWDFMSLLKSLQRDLTCVYTPWMPGKNAVLARFINEIVHGEESDVNEEGMPKSHFEMYVDAMNEISASTIGIHNFMRQLEAGKGVFMAIESADLNEKVKDFLRFTFETIESGKNHLVASAFTFGREDVIPDMFFEIIKNAEEKDQKSAYPKLTYYLERHIEVDGGEHGPLSLQMIEELCGDDDQKWAEVETTAIAALEQRIALWDAIQEEIKSKKLAFA